MSQKINLLILDEPTNHLDVDSRDWIEEAVRAYGGNLLFVSHDRYFINEFAQRVWMLENKQITDFKGTYQEYLEYLERQKAFAKGAVPPPPKEEPKKEKPKRPGGTKELEKQVNAAEREVARAEERMYELEQEIEAASSNYLQLQELYERRQVLEDEIAALYRKWEALAAELEEAQA